MVYQKQKIATIGAGTGMSGLLKGLKPFAIDNLLDLVAIVGVTDNGGHSGKIRKEMRESGLPMPQPGDGRICILEGLATIEHEFNRLPDGTHPANAYIAGLVKKHGSLSKAFAILGKQVKAAGRVIPSTDADVEICASYNGGKVIVGEWGIIDHNNSFQLENLYLSQPAEACPEAISSIRGAEYLILGPGSLRTGIISALLPTRIKETIQPSQFPMIYICNLMSQPGQTDGLTAADHLSEIERYAGRLPDILIFNTGRIPDKVLKHYAELSMNGKPTSSYPIEEGNIPPGVEIIRGDFVPSESFFAKGERIGEFRKWTHLLTHDYRKLAKVIAEIIGIQQ